ncbi:rod shape-determining protein MreD [Rhodobacteraceae bacterium WD3A24]|nr:rod shape-determining protein MreD [Rhodobacteraceae bacterium WD3A24]
MAETSASRAWVYWLLFAGLGALTLFFRLLPLGGGASGLPAPDVTLCLAVAWVLRRPDYMPAPLVAGVVLVEDLLLLRPPGLWALIALAATEFLRARHTLMRELSFVIEWAVVAGVMLAMVVVQRLVLFLLMAPQPALGLALLHIILTILFYPVVVAVSHYLFNVRKPATGEVDALGRPI